MIKEIMLAGALLANNNAITYEDFYDKVELCEIYYERENLGENPIYLYDIYTNRYAYESGYYYGQTSFPHIEQELDYYGVYYTNPITLLDQGFYPYAQSYSYDYYYLDININIKSLRPYTDARYPDAEDDQYIVLTTFNNDGELQDYTEILVSPLRSGGYCEYSFNIGDYLDFIYYKPTNSEFNNIDFENQARYLGLSLMDFNLSEGFNTILSVEYSITEWEYIYSENGTNFNSIDLIDSYINKELITNSNEFKTLNSQYYELSNDYENLDANYINLERLYQELQQENEELRANAITGNTFGSVIKIISDNAAALLETEILPNFTIGNIIFIPVIFSLIGIIFKFFRR